MNALALPAMVLPATRPEVLDAIYALETISLERCEQLGVATEHLLHAGMYVRTLRIPWNERIDREGGVVLTGALVKPATVLVICGPTQVLDGDGRWCELDGYNVMAGSAGRKQVFWTRGPVVMTMMFPTTAQTVEQAEAEFTDDCERLSSRHSEHNTVRITGA